MKDTFTDLHDELRATARDLLSEASTPSSGGQCETAPTSRIWRLFARSGWLSLEVPEAADGAGATFAEVAVVLEEMGRAATPGPYLGTAVLGVGALLMLQETAARDA